ncbi:NAD-dependent epimerase/dehydratase family protein [Actomonas aquatica]|uniref:NAD-dependent epimerase/dehydratase family protein n=1 Tax=Actomonas aquatica TaxID=2866162 RepID=A0ABZ1C9X4_9BACT|nr:NAD-dependent epimerase/dehydratase family protein [Opitutus sp. WL0086]WRQ88450.1 NAD-dependent epimerase/dehydratase family protein [Opitutus sp. WL0086]
MPASLADGFFDGKRALVCGPGYVGGAVVEALLGRGAEVTVLARSEATGSRWQSRGCAAVVADVAADDWHDRLTPAFDLVLFSVSSGGGGVAGYRHSYLAGMQSLSRWAQEHDSSAHLIYTGSTSVYAADGGVRVEEDAALELSEERAVVLSTTEEAVRAWPGHWTVMRLAGIYGPSRHYLLDGLRAGHATVPGRSDYHLNLAHRDDIVSAILVAWSQPSYSAGETFNVADDGAATKGDVVAHLASTLGRPVPDFTGVSAPGRRAYMPDRIISNAKLKRVLGWRPRYASFREGYAAILEA